MRELRKCEGGCGKYFWTFETHEENARDLNAEKLKFCRECLEHKVNKPLTLREIERENTPITEEEKQKDELQEAVDRFRRYKTN